MARAERTALIVLSALSAALRAVAFFHYRFDSDESQHLHVAWGWTAGLLQYRDLFDNHAPLFHMITAPVLAAVGEREDVLLYMRAPMLLPWMVVLWATFVVARRLYSQRLALWSTLLLSFLPPFFLKSLEYRTDNLWNALWMITLVIVTGGELTAARLFAAGIVLGLAMVTSLKTMLLILSLAAAGVALVVIRKTAMRWTPLAAIPGIAIPPVLLGAYFYSRGAWHSLVYCVFRFNALLEQTHGGPRIWLPRLMWIGGVYVIIRVALRNREAPPLRFFCGFLTAFFLLTLFCFWILISPRDYLPVLPLLTIFTVAALERRPRFARAGVAALLVLFIGLIAHETDGFRDETPEQITMMHQLLRLTRPGEPVMDIKGETIFRPRPYYYIFEFITRNAMFRGLIPDTIPEDVVRARCYVAEADGVFFPPRGRAFLNANFMDLGRLRAAGQWIKDDGSFTIAIPGAYVMVAQNGEAAGTLDGRPYDGARALAAGPHRFSRRIAEQRVACLWAQAYRRGFSPFHLQDRDF